MNFYNTVSEQEAEEVMHAFKTSIEDYQSAITLDITQSGQCILNLNYKLS